MEWFAIQKEVVALDLSSKLYNHINNITIVFYPFWSFLSSSFIFCLYPIYCYNLCSQFNTCVPHLRRFLYISLHLFTSLLSTSLPLNTLISLSLSLFLFTSHLHLQTSNLKPIPTILPTIHNATQSERLQFHTGKQSQQQWSGGRHRSPKSNNQSRPQTSGGRPQQGRPNIRWDAAIWLGQTTLEVVVLSLQPRIAYAITSIAA